jgi:hypothetical protein
LKPVTFKMNSRLTTCVTGCCPAHTKYKTIYASLEVTDGTAGKISILA